MTDYTAPQNDRRTPAPQGWHLDKKVPLSLIFAMLMQCAMVIWAIADIKKDVELIKADNVTLHKADDVASNTLRDSVATFNTQLSRIDMKLDRLIERSMK